MRKSCIKSDDKREMFAKNEISSAKLDKNKIRAKIKLEAPKLNLDGYYM